MSLALTDEEQAIAAGRDGKGAAMAMRIVAESARLLGAPRLIPIASAHIDGALYHGDSGTLFAEALVEGGAKVKVRCDAQCRGARPDGLLAHPPGGADALDGAADDGGLSHARLRAELDLRALSGRPSAGARQRRRLGRVQRRRVLQFRARRAHQPLRRLPRHRLRDRRPRAGLRLASAGKPPGDARLRCRRIAGILPRLRTCLADPWQPLRPRQSAMRSA